MASEVEICNRALQKLGAGSIVSLGDDSKRARECNRAYAPIRDATLRKHPWNFAIARQALAASSTPPTHGPANAFPLPSDCLRLLPPDPFVNFNDLDWQIEGRSILTNDAAPLNVRYIRQITDPNIMDPLYREALATEIAFEICEAVTQSNTKKEGLREDLKTIIAQAKLLNAIENVAAEPPEDTWITARTSGNEWSWLSRI